MKTLDKVFLEGSIQDLSLFIYVLQKHLRVKHSPYPQYFIFKNVILKKWMKD